MEGFVVVDLVVRLTLVELLVFVAPMLVGVVARTPFISEQVEEKIAGLADIDEAAEVIAASPLCRRWYSLED